MLPKTKKERIIILGNGRKHHLCDPRELRTCINDMTTSYFIEFYYGSIYYIVVAKPLSSFGWENTCDFSH